MGQQITLGLGGGEKCVDLTTGKKTKQQFTFLKKKKRDGRVIKGGRKRATKLGGKKTVFGKATRLKKKGKEIGRGDARQKDWGEKLWSKWH